MEDNLIYRLDKRAKIPFSSRNIFVLVFVILLFNLAPNKAVAQYVCPSTFAGVSSGNLIINQCAPAYAQITYEYNFGTTAPSTTSFRVLVNYGDGTLQNHYPTVQSKLLGGFTVYYIALELYHTFPINGNCDYTVNIAIYTSSGGICSDSRQSQVIGNWHLDNDATANGRIELDPEEEEVCEGSPLLNFIFQDDSNYACNLQDDPALQKPNHTTRYQQYVYGTNPIAGQGIPNLYITVGGSDIYLTDATGAPISFGTPSGFYEGPVDAITLDGATGAYSLPDAYPISFDGVGTVANDQFEVTVRNWNTCNSYPGNSPLTATGRILIIDAPDPPDITSRTICFDDSRTLSTDGGYVPEGTVYWYSDAALTTEVTTGTSYTIPDGDFTGAGVYEFWLVDKRMSGNLCASPASYVSLTVREELDRPGPITASADPVCVGTTGITYSVAVAAATEPVGGATRYVWSVPSGWTITSGQYTQMITVTAPGTGSSGNVSVYRQYMTSPTCSSTSRTLSVTAMANSVGGTITGTAGICLGTTESMTLAGYTGTILRWEYSTNGGSSWSTISGSAGDPTVSYTPSTAGTWLFRAVVQNNPCSVAYSNEYSVVVSPVTVLGTLTRPGTNTCINQLTGNFTYTGYVGTITRWRVRRSGTSFWSTTTTSSETFAFTPTVATTYYVRAYVQSGYCNEIYSETTIVVDPASVGGTVSSTTICATNTATLNLTGETGDVVRWEYSDVSSTGPWTNVANTTTSLTTPALTADRWYRAYVQSGTCSATYSSVGSVTVDPLSVGGSVSGGSTICQGSPSGTLTLSGNTGSVQRWEYSTNSGSTWTTISNTSTTYTAPGAMHSSPGTYWYRAVVKSGVCSEANSAYTVVTVDTPTVPGSMSGGTTICHNDNSGTLTLSGYTGSILRWQYSTNGGSSWTNITNTSDTYTATSLAAGGGNTTVQNYLFRAVVQSGVCTVEYSTATTVTVYPTTVGGTVTGVNDEICYDEPNTGTMTLSGRIGSVLMWQRQLNSTTGTWENITNTADTYTDNTPLTAGTWYYRAVVQSGPSCGVEYSAPHDIVVHPQFSLAQLGGAASICNNTSTNLTVTMTGGTSPYTVNYTLEKDGGGAVAQTPLSGYTSGTPFSTGNLTTGEYVYTITSVTDAHGCSVESTGSSITVSVGTTPASATLTGSGDVCYGTESFIYSTITGGAPNYTFNYSVFDGSSTTNLSVSYAGDGSDISLGALPVGSYTVTITSIVDNCGTSMPVGGLPSSYSFDVDPIPDISATTTNSAPICNGGATEITLQSTVASTDFNWSVTNISPAVTVTGTSSGSRTAGNGYVIAQNLSHTHTGPVTVTYEITSDGPGATDCAGNTITRDVVVNPVPQVEAVSDQVVCNGSSTTAVNFTTTNTGGSNSYSWTNDTPGIGIGASGTGNIGAFSAVNGGTAPIVATITVTPTYTYGGTACTGDGSTQKSFTITINPTVTMDAVGDQVVCNGSNTTAITFGTDYTGGTGSVTYSWTNSESSIGIPATGSGNIPAFTATNAGSSPITATIVVTPTLTNDGESCTGNSTSFTITVNPTVTVDAISDQIVCDGGNTTSVVFASTGFSGGTITYNWSNDNTSIGLGATGTNATGIPSFTAQNSGTAPVTATITVTPTFTSGGESCTGTQEVFTITVNPTVSANSVTDKVYCNGATAPVIPFSTDYTGGTGSVTYAWSNDNTSIGLGASGTGNLPSFTATNGTSAPISATITVTPTLNNGGPACTGNNTAFTITVNPTVTVDAISDQIVCDGSSTTGITFASTGFSGGTITYNWTNDTPAIGLASSGSNATGIPSFTAQNSGTGPLTATITVTPTFTNGGVSCTGTQEVFTITVNPTVTTNSISDQVICNGGTTTAVTFGVSAHSGGTVSYRWENDNTAIGLAASGTTSSIPAFAVSNNPGTAPEVATITVYPVFTNSGGGPSCEGTPEVFTISVNPTVSANAISNQIVCDNAATALVTFGVSAHSGGTVTYRWSNDNTDIGLGATGTGATIPSFTATNSTSGPITGNITVTPVFTNSSGGSGCDGTPTTFSITVNPTVTATALSDQIICNGGTTTGVTFGVSAHSGGTVTYRWENDNTAIGLGASGTGGTISSFTVSNNPGTAPVVATITVYPIFTNSGGGPACEGTPESFTISVNPTVSATAITDQVVCNGGATALVTFGVSAHAGGTVTYRWSNDNTTIGLGANGTGATIPSFTATNSTTAPVTANITVTPVFTNSSGGSGCDGTPTTFSITVNPTVSATAISNQIVCDNATTALVTFGVSAHSGGTVTYRWSNDNTNIGLGATGTGATIPSFTATNSTNAPITGNITVTPEFTYSGGGSGCDGTPTTFSITVNPTVTTNSIADQVICNGGGTTAITFGVSAHSGGTVTYRWENDNTAIGLGASGTGTGIASFTVSNNPGTAPVVATITVYPIFTNSGGGPSCEGTPESFTIAVNPTVSANAISNQIVCNNEATTSVTFGVSAHSGGTVSYRWDNDNTAIGLGASGSTSGISSFTATNTGTSPIVANITVTPVFSNSSGGPGCDGTPTSFSITVNPTAQVNNISGEVVCNGDATTAVTFTTDRTGGTTTYAWSINAAIGLSPTTGSGNFPSFTAVNSGTSPVTATVTVTPTFTSGGKSCSGPAKTFTITVNPTAQANDPGDRILCWGDASGAINFSTTNSGGTTTYTWTNSNTDIGLGASGSGNITSFTATNTTTVPITGTITITPTFTNGGKSCSGPVTTFDITVNPRAQVDDPADLTRCNGEGVPLITFTTQNTGGTTTYSWTNSLTSIGLGASGTGNIPAFTATNTGTATVTATITVTPHYTNTSGGATCDGPTQTFTITVYPTPGLSTTLLPAEICSNNNFVYTPASATAGTTFAWSRGALPSGVTAAGAATGTDGISDLLRNVSSATQTVEYTYTLTANGCVNTQIVTATVKPEPVISDQTPVVCSGQTLLWRILMENFTYPDVTFTWPAPVTSAGVTGGTARGAASSADINDSFINTTGSDGTATYTVTPLYNGCAGDPKDIIVTVGSQPVLADLDGFACSNVATGLTLAVDAGSSAADRYYVIAIDVDPGLIAAGGNASTLTMGDDPNGVAADYLASDSFLNTSGSNLTVTYTVRPSYGTDCLGDEKDIVITVRPQPVIQAGQVATVCSDEIINFEILLNPLNTPAGTTFSWDLPTMSDGSVQGTAVTGLAADPAGTYHITDALHNSTGSPITATYNVTPTSAFGCVGVEIPVVITINPEPVTSAITGDAVLCEGATNKVYSVANNSGSTYDWGVTSGLNKTVDVGMYFIAVEAVGGHTGADTVWVVETTSSTGCVGDTVYMEVNVVDVIPGVVVSGPTELCLHDTATYSVPYNASSVYSWTVPAGAVILTDPSLNTVDITFNVTLSGTAGGISVHETTGGACTTDHITTYVTVHPLPTVYNLTSPPAYCAGGSVDITLSGSQTGVAYQLYKDNVAEDAPVGGTGAALVWSGKTTGTYFVIATNTTTTCAQVMNGTPSPYVNTVDGGSIEAVQAICPGSSPNPFTSLVSGVGAGSITYQWQSSNDNFVANINNIAGATSEVYAPVSLGSDTWFRRVTISTVGSSVCEDYSNIIYIDAIVFDPGNVTADQTICDNSVPAAFGSVTPTGDGVFTYQWQSSTDGFNFTNITGADLETYTPTVALTQDTWYRRQVTSTLLGVACVKFTPAIKVTVVNFLPGSVSSDQVICLGSTPSPFTSIVASGDGTFTYQWQDSTVTSGVWQNVTTGTGSTSANYAPAALTENTWFRRVVTARDASDMSVACVDITNTVLVSVIDFDPGTISGDQTICEGSAVTSGFTGTAAASNTADTYTFTYQWQKYSGSSFVDVTGATGADYTPVEALYADTRYRRVVVATYGSRQCQSVTNEITVTVNNITVGTVTGTQTICEGSAPTVLSYSGNSGEAGATVTHQWEYSTDNWASSTPVGAVDDMTLSPGPLSADTRFRVVASSVRNGVTCVDISNDILVTVINFVPGNIGSDQTICEGSYAAVLSSVTPTGDGVFSYRWYEGTAVDPNIANPVLTFVALPSSNSETWNPGILGEDRWYFREVTATLNGVSCVEHTDTVWVRVNNLDAGSMVTADYTICDGATMTDIDATAATADGTVAYMWQISSDGVNFSDTGVTTEDFAATAITADTWFRRVVTSTVTAPVTLSCIDYTGTVKVTVINFIPGGISSDQTICYGSAPSAFTSVAASGDGVITYQWQDSTATSGVWQNVASGGTGATYSAGVLTENTWFRRVATATLNSVSCDQVSNTVRITVIDFDPGAISADQVICEGEIPAVITGTAASDSYPADGYVYSYQWQSRTASGSYVNIPLATGADFTPTEQLYEDMFYRRRVTATAAGAQCVLYTNEIHITVNNFTVGSITANQTICESATPATLLYSGTPVGGDGDSYDLMWQYKTVSDIDFIDIATATSDTYDPAALTEDTWFRLKVTSNIGATNSCPKYTNEIKVTVNNFDPGITGTDQIICANTAASSLGSTTAPSGDGLFTYLWYSSTDGVTYASTGVTTESLSPGVLGADMWYYRSVTSTLNGTACTEDNLPVYVQVNNVDAGTITGEATICDGTAAGTISSNADYSGDGVVTFQWYGSVDGVAFTAITGATTDSYAPGVLGADMWYRLRVTSTIASNVCYEETASVRVTVVNFTPGTVSSDQVICYNTAPAAFTATAPSGDGIFTYRWEESADGVTYAPIAGATGATYTSPALTADTWFRRVTISTLNAVSCEQESNGISVDVIVFDQGSIGGDQDICEGSVPALLTSVADASGEGALQYQWQVSADNSTFTNITGATNNEYQPGALTQDTWYRRVVTSTVGSRTCTYITNTVKVTVNNILTTGSITGAQTICEGTTPAGFTSVPGTVDGALSYQWYSSTDGATYTIMAGETGELFTPVSLTQDTWYQRYVVSTMGALVCEKETGTIKVTVNNFDPGSITGEQTICEGTPASVITSVTPTGDGVFSYRWYSSTVSDVAGFTVIAGALSETYYPGALSQDTWFYREVTSTLNGTACAENTNVVKVTVNNMTPGTIGSDETMCAGTVPAMMTMATAPYFDGGTPSYQWMSSMDNVNFTSITGANSNSYQPAALTQDTWYKLVVTSTLNGIPCSGETNVVFKEVNNVSGGSIISDQAICNGGDPVTFVSTLNGSGDGVISYRWEQSNTGGAGTFTAIAGTNSPTYDPPALSGDRYYRRVTISEVGALACEALSNTVKVTVNTVFGGAIATAQEICFGETPVAFTSADPGSGTGTVTYRWYRSSDGVYFSIISGANGATYAPGVLYADAWYKRELVSNLTGNVCTAESNILHITVHPRPVAILSGGATICPGDNTDLTVEMMTGTGPYDVELTSSADGSVVTVTGYVSGDPIPVSPPATTTYTLTSVTDVHGCAVTTATYPSNLSGSAQVTVRMTPAITTPPVDVTQCEYGVASFTVAATGTDVAYQWYENGAALSDGGMYFGVNNASLNIYGVLRGMDGNVYNVVVSNCSTDVPSTTAMLTVNTAPEITDQPDDVTICSTQGATFEVVAQGTSVTYQWQVNRQDGMGFVNVTDDSNFSGSDLSVLTLTNVPGSFNNYIFRVRLNGTCGSAVYSNFVALRVNVPPTVTRDPVDAALCDGEGLISFTGGGSGLIDSLRWQVSTDGVTWNDIYDNSVYSGTMSQQLTIIDVPIAYDGYLYRLALKAVCSTVYSSAATLTVHANPVVDFSTVDPIAACGGVVTVIDGNPTGGSGVYTQHTWTGDVGPLSNYFIQAPDFLTSVAGSYNLTYKVTDSNGCVAEGDVEVVVEMPDASYTMNASQGCTPAEVTFTKNMSGIDHWEWDFGDGTTNTADASPVHSFTNTNATAIEYYNVTLTVWTASGCSADFTRMITVYPAVDATFTAANDSICSGDPLAFTGVTGASSYFWDFGDGVTGSGEYNATHIYTNVTAAPVDVTVTLTARSFYGCEETETITITVMPVAAPQFSITETPPYIYDPAGNTLHFVNNTGAGAWSYLWDFGDGATSTETNPVHTYNDLGDYEVSLTVSNALCTSDVVRTVSILPRAPIAAFNEIPSGCSPLVIAPVNTSEETQYPGTSYLWDFGDGSYSTAENPEYTYHTDGVYRVELTVTGPGGVSSYSQVVEVYASPNAYLEVLPTAVFVNDEAVRCFNLSVGADYYLWEFGDGDTSRLEEPYHKYMEEGVYDITLWAYSENGCSDRYVLSPGVTVEPSGELAFATVFRPSLAGPTTSDGGDGGTPIALPEGGEELDRYFFPPIREKVTGYKLQIFNRLGVLIFQSDDINTPWDGYYRGKVCPQGVYVWYVEGKYSNGEPFRQVGDITLLY